MSVEAPERAAVDVGSHRPPVTALIPTCGALLNSGRLAVELCLWGLARHTDYDGTLRIVIIVDTTAPPVLRDALQDLVGAAGLDGAVYERRDTVPGDPGPFNYSAVNNAAASVAPEGGLLLLLNDDVRPGPRTWLTGLVDTATSRPDAGAVGATLLLPDGRVQHAGVVFTDDGLPGHRLYHAPRSALGLVPEALDVPAVTGACLLTPADLFWDLRGLDPAYPVTFGDTDYCLRVREAGRTVLLAPPAVWLYHDESTSRDPRVPAAALDDWRARWPVPRIRQALRRTL